ncbi:hypothetical protein HPB52_004536 [Rhipicephalus sanguineus]|uniref:Uncharacterized protein n=1 Tax=Rhipicephalus sanguineus TaxID=34632 RepID=A0A9D4SMB6_RHISA|nr:hypothetical protein HPB52_004536 [Rhipicephalus sanguineus]
MADAAKKPDAPKEPEKTDGDKKEPDKKDGEKPADTVDKDYVIFHFPGVEQKDGTSAGCETLKIPRDAAIGLVEKVRPAVARLVERCHCNDPAPEPEDVEPMVPCVDCMAELKAEARRLSTKAFVQTAVSDMSIQQPCPFKAQSLTMTKTCPIPPQAPPLPDKITQQMSFIKISCGKCGAEQVMDPAHTAAVKAPAAAAATAAHAGTSTSGAGHCTGPAMMNVVSVDPGSSTHFQFTCHCLEQFGHASNGGGHPLPPIPHMPDCCYSLGGGPHPPTGRASSSRDHHNDRVRDRLIREECIMKERIEDDDYGSPGRRVYEEFEERLTYGGGGGGGGRSRSSRDFYGGGGRGRHGRGRHEEDLSDLSEGDDDDGRYSVRRTSSGNVAIIGDDNYKVRVEVGGRRSEGRRRGYR